MSSFPVTVSLRHRDTGGQGDELKRRGKITAWAGTPPGRRAPGVAARSALCLGEGGRAPTSSFPSRPFPCRGKNESLSQQLAPVIPQYRPGIRTSPAAEALRSDITSPVAFYGHVDCQQNTGSLMRTSRGIRRRLVFVCNTVMLI